MSEAEAKFLNLYQRNLGFGQCSSLALRTAALEAGLLKLEPLDTPLSRLLDCEAKNRREKANLK